VATPAPASAWLPAPRRRTAHRVRPRRHEARKASADDQQIALFSFDGMTSPPRVQAECYRKAFGGSVMIMIFSPGPVRL